VKELPESLRLGYANLVLAMADKNFARAVESYKYNTFSLVMPSCNMLSIK
jgi:hypothetical protein